jgi:hypothetical protein
MKKIVFITFALGFSISMLNGQNHCLSFDGINQYVEISNSPELSFGLGDEITLEAWINPGTVTGGFRSFLQKGGITSYNTTNYTLRQTDRVIEFFYWSAVNGWNGVQTSSTHLAINTWTHVAVTFQYGTQSSMKMYINGQSVPFFWTLGDGSTAPLEDSQPVRFGGISFWNHRWVGTMDEVKIWNVMRSEAEIQQYLYQSIPNPASEANLVAYFDFNEGTGQVLNDLSTSTNDGQLGSTPNVDIGDPIWGNCQIPGFNIQNCLDFDGVNDYVTIPHSSTLNFGTGDFTIEAWILNSNTTGSIWKRIFTKRGNASAWYSLSLNFNRLIIELAGGVSFTAGPAIQNDGRWHHVAAIRSGNTINLYIDGNKYSGTSPSYGINTDNNFLAEIGNWLTEAYGGEKYRGKIDEIRVWNIARTDSEIRENIHRELPNPLSEPNLMAYYNFNQSSGTVLPDYSSNSNNGTLTNMDPATDWIASTAPIPYQTIIDGNWGLDATWYDGQMVPVNDWSRVEINNVVDYNAYEILEDLTINSGGQLEMFPGYQLNVNGNLVNNAGTNGLILRSDYLETATIIENDGVEATVERSFAGNGLDWHLISPPVSNALSGVFNDMYLQQFNEATNTYSEIIPSTVPLGTMKGYAVYSTLANMNTVSYSGNLNAGTLNKAVTANMANGWNLVGNPYPSALDWNAVIPGLSGINSSIYYLDAASGNWLSWNGTTGSGSRYAPPGQGFFVSATAAATLSFDNSMRTHDVFWMFYKDEVSDLLILKAEGNGFEDKTYIHFNSEATEAFNGQFDAYKIFSEFNPELPQIYTKAGEDNLSINELPETESMILGFKADIPGIYSINMEEANDFTTVILEDTKTGITTDLLSNNYNFSYSVDEAAERFILHFSPLGVNDVKVDNIQVYSVDNIVYVNLSEAPQVEYAVLNMMGQEIKSGILDSQNNSISLNTETGYYVLKIITGNTVVSRKVFIK